MTSTVPRPPADATGWSGYFDDYAPTYDVAAFGGAGLATVSRRELDEVRRALRGRTPGKVLDAGAGTGRVTAVLTEARWSVVALDASREMLDRLRQSHPDVDTVETALGGVLPFHNETFDAVVAMRVLKYVDDVDCALHELSRVARPGSPVVVEFANRRSVARFGYRGAPIRLVTMREIERRLRAADLVVHSITPGPTLPQPVWARARTARMARAASACDRTVASLLGGRRSSLGARSIIVTAIRR